MPTLIQLEKHSMHDAICTLVTNDDYVKGAIVVARSVRLAGMKQDLAVLVTEEVSPPEIAQLKQYFDHIVHVQKIVGQDLAQLQRLGRANIASAMTKINLWQQTQFRNILYLDADTLCLKNLDSLFSLNVDFAACPDTGFADYFNSGVMVLKPSLAVYADLKEMVVANASFDGADQGLLNMYFQSWHRLSCIFNCLVHRKFRLYMPAVQRNKDQLSVVHFVGKDKPWTLKKAVEPWDDSDFARFYVKLVERWWDVYDEIKQEESVESSKGRA